MVHEVIICCRLRLGAARADPVEVGRPGCWPVVVCAIDEAPDVDKAPHLTRFGAEPTRITARQMELRAIAVDLQGNAA